MNAPQQAALITIAEMPRQTRTPFRERAAWWFAQMRKVVDEKSCPRCGSPCRKRLIDNDGHWHWACTACIWTEVSP